MIALKHPPIPEEQREKSRGRLLILKRR